MHDCFENHPKTNRSRKSGRHGAWIAVAAALAAAAVQAQPPVDTCGKLSIDTLKAAYLACDRRMSSQRVDTTLAQRCGAIGEALQQRGFGGDFDRLIDWWRQERGADSTGVAIASLPACGSDAPSGGKGRS